MYLQVYFSLIQSRYKDMNAEPNLEAQECHRPDTPFTEQSEDWDPACLICPTHINFIIFLILLHAQCITYSLA